MVTIRSVLRDHTKVCHQRPSLILFRKGKENFHYKKRKKKEKWNDQVLFKSDRFFLFSLFLNERENRLLAWTQERQLLLSTFMVPLLGPDHARLLDDSLLAAPRKRRKEVTIDHLWWHQPSIDRFFSPFLCADSSGQQTNRIAPQALSGWKVNRQGQEIVRSVLLSLSNCFLQGNEREKKYERISCTRLTFSPLMRLVTIHLQDPFSL